MVPTQPMLSLYRWFGIFVCPWWRERLCLLRCINVDLWDTRGMVSMYSCRLMRMETGLIDSEVGGQQWSTLTLQWGIRFTIVWPKHGEGTGEHAHRMCVISNQLRRQFKSHIEVLEHRSSKIQCTTYRKERKNPSASECMTPCWSTSVSKCFDCSLVGNEP